MYPMCSPKNGLTATALHIFLLVKGHLKNTLSVSKMEAINYVNSGRQRLKALSRKVRCLKKFPVKNSHMMPMLRLVKNTTC